MMCLSSELGDSPTFASQHETCPGQSLSKSRACGRSSNAGEHTTNITDGLINISQEETLYVFKSLIRLKPLGQMELAVNAKRNC